MTAFVTFDTPINARNAVKTLHNELLNGTNTYSYCILIFIVVGNELDVKLLSKDIKSVNQRTLKKSRVIVRNLSFKVHNKINFIMLISYISVLRQI